MKRLSLLLALALIPAMLLAADGKQLYNEKLCVNCHGEGGTSSSPQFPYLAGQNKQYLLNQFKSIIHGDRAIGSAILMGKHPKLHDFSEPEIDAIVSYLSGLPRPTHESNLDPKMVAKGLEVYQAIGCKQCHGDEGKGMPAGSPAKYDAYPKLNGQHSVYIYNQLKNILAGKRNNDNADIMKKQLEKAQLSDQDLKSLAAYLSQIH